MAGRAPRTALVTGAAGFAGQWLCRDLVQHGWIVTGTSLEGDPGAGVLTKEEHDAVTWLRQDLREPHALRDALDAAQPEVIFHLAGVSFVPAAGSDPMLAFEVNAGTALRLLQAVRVRRVAGTLDPIVLVVGSGEQYGRHDSIAMPLGEEAECRPCTLYAATKMAQEVFAFEAFRSDEIQVICTRSFNHSGPGQSPAFLLPALVSRALRARADRGSTIEIGNADSIRDYLHVEDAVRAYVLLAERGFTGDAYNVCSGEGIAVGDVAADVLRILGLAAELAPVETLRRRSDIPVLIGRNQKLCTDTGWAPRHSREDILTDLIHAASH